MKNTVLTFIAALLLSFTAKAQEGFSAGINLSPAITNFTGFLQRDVKPTFQLNYGLEVAYRFPHLQFSVGVKQLSQVGKAQADNAFINNPDFGPILVDVYFVSRTLIVPFRADYYFNPDAEIQIFAGLGLAPGIVYTQDQENKLIKGGVGQMEALDEFYLGGNVGLGLQYNLNNAVQLRARPNLYYQLNGRAQEIGAGETTTFNTWSAALDISLHYSF